LGRDSPLKDPEPSIRVRPEMFGEIHIFSGPVLGPRIEQENIFSAQTSICEYKFPRKRVPAAAACARHHDARATGNGGYGSIATNGRNLPRNEIENVKSTMCQSFDYRIVVQRRKE
jgi:hypothetical protein